MGVFEVLQAFGVLQVLLVRIWSILGRAGKGLEYFQLNTQEEFRVNEVSRRLRAAGAFQSGFGIFSILLVRIWNILSTADKDLEYFKCC